MASKNLWQKISFLGLKDHEEFEYREIILLNRLIAIASIMMFGMIPIEIVINGLDLVPYEILAGVLSGIALLFTYLRWFNLAKFYFFFMAITFIFALGIAVGEGSGNEFFLVPVFIFPSILFKDKKTVIFLSLIALGTLLLLKYAHRTIDPVIDIPMEVKRQISYVFYTILLLMVFFEIYYFKGMNDKFQHLLATKNKEIADKNKEIVDSITYAKRIQEAILPPKQLIDSLLPDSFILFKPKDIVAGDFYWVEEKNGNVIFAAADCTGHGVPGAMVSVVCDNALKKAVNEFGLTDPGKILDKTKELVTEQFLKGNEDVKDGMDIALCSLDLQGLIDLGGLRNAKLKYAGANNPLWVLRKDSSEIEEIKATKQPVGKSTHDLSFETHTLELKPGDRIYIFSDGYADQFGGDKGKKFKYKSFKELLVKIGNLSMAEQKEKIEDVFETWKGDFEQLDDVCVIGVRI